jgi:hypothetical protein
MWYGAGVLVILIVLVWLLSDRIENFVNPSSPTVVYSSQRLNHDAWLGKAGYTDTQSIDIDAWNILLKYISKNGGWPSELRAGTKQTLIVCDPIDQERVPGLGNVIDKGPSGYFVSLASSTTAFKMECTYNFGGKTIGYLDRSDLYFIKAILKGYRIPEGAVKLRSIPPEDWGRLGDLLAQEFDQIITYVVPKSPFHMLLWTQPISLQGFQGINIDRLKMFYPYISPSSIDLKATFVSDRPGAQLLVMDKERSSPAMEMRMRLVRVAGGEPEAEGFLTQSPIDTPRSALDPSYTCYGDRTIEQKMLCDSKYDAIGEPKKKATVWDRPCFQDSDCPYYDGRKGRGGCLQGGMCEFPIGAKQASFRTFSGPPYAPFCYGCDPYDTQCCAKKKDVEYVFTNENRRISEI